MSVSGPSSLVDLVSASSSLWHSGVGAPGCTTHGIRPELNQVVTLPQIIEDLYQTPTSGEPECLVLRSARFQ